MTTRIRSGQIAAFFAFDIGYEVSLEKLATVAGAMPVQPISRKRQTPPHMQYSRPPVILNLPGNEMIGSHVCQLQATIFEFGAASIAYRWRFGHNSRVQIEDLPS
jgi:hypothetical protein